MGSTTPTAKVCRAVYGLGDSIEEAKTSMLQGIRHYILECKKDGRPIPAARTIYSETVSVAFD